MEKNLLKTGFKRSNPYLRLSGKRMKKTLMALGGDDTKEEVRDLLNQSDISIIGAKVLNGKANLLALRFTQFHLRQ